MRFQGCYVWEQLLAHLESGSRAVLMYVLDSSGSSPGRRGFAMAVLDSKTISGTIGGGIMEYKLVEFARSLLDQNLSEIALKAQHHSKDEPADQSGMICSGTQYIAIIPVNATHIPTITGISNACQGKQQGLLRINASALSFHADILQDLSFSIESTTEWRYSEPLGQLPRVHIIGAGHVGLALSEQLNALGFHVTIYDDRSQLNTFEQNAFAHKKVIIDYNSIGEVIPGLPEEYVVIMTFGYRTDKIVLEQLMDKPFKYLGMMGSERKIELLYEELEKEGIASSRYRHLHAPVGIPIYSKTAREIAVSVAGEIIREKNKDLPTGRTGINF